MVTRDQHRKFGDAFLQSIIEWIKENIEPDEVFGEEAMEAVKKQWCKDYASTHFAPWELFARSDLEAWAEDEGFVEASE